MAGGHLLFRPGTCSVPSAIDTQANGQIELAGSTFNRVALSHLDLGRETLLTTCQSLVRLRVLFG